MATQEPALGFQRSQRPHRQNSLQRLQAAPPVVGRSGTLPERATEPQRLLQEPDFQLQAFGFGKGAELVARCANHRHRGRCSKPDDRNKSSGASRSRSRQWPNCPNRNAFDSVSSQRWASLARAFSRSEDWTVVQTASVLTAATTSDSAPATTARRRRRAQRSTPNRQCGSRAKARGRSLHQRSRSSASSEARL